MEVGIILRRFVGLFPRILLKDRNRLFAFLFPALPAAALFLSAPVCAAHDRLVGVLRLKRRFRLLSVYCGHVCPAVRVKLCQNVIHAVSLSAYILQIQSESHPVKIHRDQPFSAAAAAVVSFSVS